MANAKSTGGVGPKTKKAKAPKSNLVAPYTIPPRSSGNFGTPVSSKAIKKAEHKGVKPLIKAKSKNPTTFLLKRPPVGTKSKWNTLLTGSPKGATSKGQGGSKSGGTSPKGSGASFRGSVGTNGGSTSSVKHNPNTGKPGNRNSGRGSGGRGGGRGPGSGSGGKMGGGSYQKQARRYVNQDIKRQMEALRNEIDARRNDNQYANNQAESLYNRSKGDLQHVFGEASEQNNLQTQAMLNNLLGAKGQTNQVYDQLGTHQQQNTSANQAALMAELNRLGVGAGANLGQFSADSNFAQNMSEQNRANSLDNLGLMGSATSGIGNLINQTSNSSMASNIGKQLNLRNDVISGNNQEFRGNVDEIRDQMRVEKMGRGNRIWDLYRELEDQGYSRWFQNREANRSNALGWSNFNLSADGQNSDIAFQKAQMLADQRSAAAERRAIQNQMRNLGSNGGGGGGGGGLAQQLYSGIFG